LEGKKRSEADIFIDYYNSYTSGSDFMENTWIADSSTTCHVTNDDSGLYKVRGPLEKVM